MKALLTLWNLARKLPPSVLGAVVEFVGALVTGKDPEDAAKRVLEENARVRAFDETAKRRYG